MCTDAIVFSMPNSSRSPSLLLCSGKGCLKKTGREHSKLTKAAADLDLRFDPVSCQGACTGPTVVVVTGDHTRWFEGVTGSKTRRDLFAFAAEETTQVSKRLAKRELTGKRRAKAAKRLAKNR